MGITIDTTQQGTQALQTRAAPGTNTFQGVVGKKYHVSPRGLSFRLIQGVNINISVDGVQMNDLPVIETAQRAARGGPVTGMIDAADEFIYLGRGGNVGNFKSGNRVQGLMKQTTGEHVFVLLHDSHVGGSVYESQRKTSPEFAGTGARGVQTQQAGIVQEQKQLDPAKELEEAAARVDRARARVREELAKKKAELRQAEEEVARMEALSGTHDEEDEEASEDVVLQSPSS